MSQTQDGIRDAILNLVADYHSAREPKPFRPGVDPVPYAGRVFDNDELEALVSASLDFWLTSGPCTKRFEKLIGDYIGGELPRYASFCNSGSSANLLAVSALTSPRLGDRRLKPGDEVITTAAGFPTTLAPIVQNGLVPVFVDIDPDTLNARVDSVVGALTHETRAVFLAHTLGNPFQAAVLRKWCNEAGGTWLIEDNCDALGAEIWGQKTGAFGHVSTCSFFPAHHITTGEGGMVVAETPKLQKIAESFRDWGRDCWCDTGCDNTCGKRFGFQLGDLPKGYDHKFTYGHIGYNLKATDLQAAIGVAQMGKLDAFVYLRRRHWAFYREFLAKHEEFFSFQTPTPGSNPSPFGFWLQVRKGAPFTRAEIVKHLEDRKIATRMLFGGNLLKQPAFQGIKHRVHGDMKHTDAAMENGFWIGVYPGLSLSQLNYVAESIDEFIGKL